MKSETGYTFILYRISIEYGECNEDEKRILKSSHTISNFELNYILREVVSEIFKNDPNVKIISSRVIKHEDGCIEYIGYLMIAGVNWLVTGDVPDDIIQELSSNIVQDIVLHYPNEMAEGFIKGSFYTYADRCEILKRALCSKFIMTLYRHHENLYHKVISRFGVCSFDEFVKGCPRINE